MPDISIIILSYNTQSITKRCLTTVIKSVASQKDLEAEIIVVDNGSQDGSVEMIKKIQNSKFKTQNDNLKLKTIFNTKNVGYPKGNNQGLEVAEGKYVLFLNSDVIIAELNFKDILNYLDKHQEVGVLTVKVNLPTGTIDPASHRGFPTPWNSICYFLRLEKLLGRVGSLGKLCGGYHLTGLDLDTIHEIDSPSGAFYLTRKEILKKTGGFDEDFFMYGEDLDLSYRIKENGYKVIYFPRYAVTHLKHVSGLKTNDQETRNKTKGYFYKAMKIFYKKHYEAHNPWFLNMCVYFFIKLKEIVS